MNAVSEEGTEKWVYSEWFDVWLALSSGPDATEENAQPQRERNETTDRNGKQ